MDNSNNLPTNIIFDILTRLPAESVFDCKLVSKTWRDLIQHPWFTKMHSNRLINHPETAYSTDSGKSGFLALAVNEKSYIYKTDKTDSGKVNCIHLDRNPQLYYFEYIENHETSIGKIKRINLKLPCKCDSFIGSFNGLICLHDKRDGVCICNPMTKEYVILPEPISQFVSYWIGFGYLPSTNEYKVVLVHQPVCDFVEVMVYTLGGGNGWRNIKFHLNLGMIYDQHGIFVNGSLHWMDSSRRKIMVFDLADENFREHLLLPVLPIHWTNYSLGVLGGFLFCALTKYNNHWRSGCDMFLSDIWLYMKKNIDHCDMKEQDEHQSLGWSKEFTYVPSMTLLAFTKSGGVLGYNSDLSTYDPKTLISKELKRVRDDKGGFHQVLPHKNTLVSLKELGEEGTKLMKSLKVRRKQKARFSQTSICS